MNIRELKGLQPTLTRKNILKNMDCYEDSPVYDEVVEEYEEIKDKMLALAEPKGIIGMTTLPKNIETEKYKEGTPIIYAALSIGNGIKECSTKGFQEGDYVKGMLCDAIADDALFSLENQLMKELKSFCAEQKVGILKRLEAPQDIPMESQKEAWDFLELEKRFGIRISTGFMFDPVKTSCIVFVVTKDVEKFKVQHDCRNCSNVTCKMRNIPQPEITVKTNKGEEIIKMKEGESFLETLIRSGYYVSAPCGGRGRCGKCKVQVLEGNMEITEEDKKIFTEKELQEGYRLSCMMHPKEDLKILFAQSDEKDFEVLAAGVKEEKKVSKETFYNIAIDIGTTTIAMELLGGETNKNIHSVTSINSQRKYGADVISRIKASTEGKKAELQASIRKNLLEGIFRLTKEAEVELSQIQRIAIAGNTTMGHLLMGYPCDTLGVYPFTPVNIGTIKGSFKEILGSEACKAEVILLPGISTYVGGDITSGLYACGFDQKEEIAMLIDLGTNGEMALGNKHKILVTSTAAGPAFEGGNITWGTGSISGAICSVCLKGKTAEIKTIHDAAPVGICGTGVVETTAELVREGWVDEIGTFDEEFFETGFPLVKTKEGKEIVFTQKDIREIQLAKAAIRAGAETLLLRYGIEREQVKMVYVAGGFGYKLNKEKAVEIGMLPEDFLNKIEAVGNSSLAGAIQYLGDGNAAEKIEKILSAAEEIGLSSDVDFNEFYMDSMMFGEEE